MKDLETIILPVLEMSCAVCANNVENTVKGLPGVEEASVNFAANTLSVKYHPSLITPQKMREAVQEAGYDLVVEVEDPTAVQEEMVREHYRKLRRNTIGAWVLSIPLALLGMVFMHTPGGNWIMMALALVIMIVFGRSFYVNGVRHALHGSANMDTLVALSTSIAFLFSFFNTVYPRFWYEKGLEPHVYYEASGVIIAFVLLGKLLEERAKNSTSSAIKSLMGLQPKTARRVRDGQEEEVSISFLRVGDLVSVRPGEKIPVDGTVELAGFGVSVTFPDGTYTAGTTYACRVLAPTPSIMDVMDALESPLALYDVEFVHIAGETDSVDWTAAQTKAEELWNLQRPTYFKMETRLPHDGEDLNDFAAYLLAEKQGFAGRFVTVCCQYGEITDSTGASRLRNAGGLQAGRVMSIPVQRATGRVKDGPVSQLTLPEGWEAVQSTLEDAGYLTAKKYAGLDGVYWGDSRTMADATSDYRYEEVLRTVFKAVRLMRIAALKSMYDEAGDPLRPDSATGLAYLQASLENALDTMVKANPKELAGYVVDIAPNRILPTTAWPWTSR